MGNLLLGHTNRADASTLSNGAWTAGLPLNNLKDGNFDKVARSSNALVTSTRFAVDMGANKSVRAIALANHNLTAAATWRVKGGTAAPDASNVFASGGVFDSGVMNALRLAFNWDAPSDWGTQYNLMYLFTPATVRYVTVDITDTANPAGYVQMGRLFLSSGFQPTYHQKYGLQDGWDDLSEVSRSPAGKRFYTRRRRPRWTAFEVPFLSLAEGDQAHEMDALLGVSEEVLYVPDLTDMALSQRYGFVGNVRELGPLEYPMARTRGKAYRIDEKI